VRAEAERPDTFYFNQFHKHGAAYFFDRIAGLAVSGRRALDAGCGVGQWSFALREHFEDVQGVELAELPVEYARRIGRAMRVDTPEFRQASIEQLPFPSDRFDFVFCYGVLFVTNINRTLAEFARVLQRGGRAYICLNGDGWYEYLCDERFKSATIDDVWTFAEPLWNALVARVGGQERFDALCAPLDVLLEPNPSDRAATRAALLRVAQPGTLPASLLESYSDRVIMLLGWLTRRHLDLIKSQPRSRRGLWSVLSQRLGARPTSADSADEFPSSGIGSSNRPFTPEEFTRLVRRYGFEMVSYGADAALSSKSRPIRPIYDGTFNGHDCVWECLLERVA
jgi:SAM-dependent methyltransferase